MAAVRELFALFDVKFNSDELKKGNKEVTKSGKELDKAGRSADKAGKEFKDGSREMGKMGDVGRGLSRVLGTLGAAIAGVAGIGAMRSLIGSTIESTNELGRWATRLNMPIQTLAEFDVIARQFGGNIDDVTDVFKELQLKARDAMTGTQSYIDSFQMIGISVEQLRPVINDQEALFNLFTDSLNRNTDAATQNFVIDELMSDAGTRMAGVFRLGTTEIARQRREVREMGVRNMPQLAEQTREYAQAQARLNARLTVFRNTVVSRILPGLTRMARAGERAVQWVERLSSETGILKDALAAIAVVSAIVAAATIATWGPRVLAVGGAVLAVGVLSLAFNDVRGAIDGGDSAIGRFIDSMTRIGATQEGILTIRNLFRDIGTLIDPIVDALDPLIQAVQNIMRISRFISGGFLADAIQASGAQEFLEENVGRPIAGALVDRERGARLTTGATPQELENARATLRMRQRRLDELNTPEGESGPMTVAGRGRTESLPWWETAAIGGPASANLVAPWEMGRNAGQTVDARMDVGGITVNEAVNAQETARLIVDQLEAREARQNRMVQNALVPEGAQ